MEVQPLVLLKIGPSFSPPLQDGQRAGEEPNNFNSEMSRLLSFPDSMSFAERRAKAARGQYWEAGRARCNFCSDVSGEHDCPLADNIPLGGDNLRHEANRLLSFLAADWPQMPSASHPVGCRDLARWGFFYTGNADAARCTFCRLEVRDWEGGDTAEAEHRRWNPQCAFLQGRLVGNVPLGEEGDIEALVWPHQAPVVEVSCGRERPQLAPTCAPRHPRYASPGSRLLSFAAWPVGLQQRPQQLSEAGFYYVGVGDRVICHQCGVNLRNWGAGVNPWTEHASWSPHCQYLLINKGAPFVETVQTHRQSSAGVTSRESPPTPPSDVKLATEDVKTADEGDWRLLCKVCLDRPLGVVFLPCGHVTSCSDCAPQLTCCPVCRAKVAGRVRVFLA